MEVNNVDMDFVVGFADGGTSEKNKTIGKYLKLQYQDDYKEYIRYCSR